VAIALVLLNIKMKERPFDFKKKGKGYMRFPNLVIASQKLFPN